MESLNRGAGQGGEALFDPADSTILAVDDSPAALKSLETVLDWAGYRVVPAASGAEALERIEPAHDLVLLDVDLPDLDGYEVLESIRAAPALAGVQVLMLTALGSLEDRIKAFEMGADDYLLKPYHTQELLVRAERLIRLKKAMEKRREAEEKLKESEAHLRQIIDLVPHMIFARNREGKFLLANRALAEAYAATVEELTGSPRAPRCVSEVGLKNFMGDDLEVIDGGREKTAAEETFLDAHGKTRFLQTVKIPYVVSGQAEPAVLGVSVDVTELKSAFEASPLTKLPGNNSVSQAIQQALDSNAESCVVYADLDYFKAYNDRYGYAAGDRLILFLADVIVETTRSHCGEERFVGHIGGDDFVFIVPAGDVGAVAEEIIERFDRGAPGFFNEEDREQGRILMRSRRGGTVELPLVSLSLAGVDLRRQVFTHFLEVAAACAEVKEAAKDRPGSVFLLDRRAEGRGLAAVLSLKV